MQLLIFTANAQDEIQHVKQWELYKRTATSYKKTAYKYYMSLYISQ